MTILSKVFSRCSDLQEINLENNGIGDDGIGKIYGQFGQKDFNLLSIHLKYTLLTSDGLFSLFQTCKTNNHSLTELDLSRINIYIYYIYIFYYLDNSITSNKLNFLNESLTYGASILTSLDLSCIIYYFILFFNS